MLTRPPVIDEKDFLRAVHAQPLCTCRRRHAGIMPCLYEVGRPRVEYAVDGSEQRVPLHIGNTTALRISSNSPRPPPDSTCSLTKQMITLVFARSLVASSGMWEVSRTRLMRMFERECARRHRGLWPGKSAWRCWSWTSTVQTSGP